ncbi:MAG: hypothetical protein OER43_14235 [Gammaproteobacteria bacterium]|nr:hypothetical protein [Gammaproteobacteria bacterium]
MKWVMYFLLLANAAFFARQYHQMSNAPPPPPQAVSPYAHVNRLLLLSETKTDKLRVRQPLPKPPPPLVAAAEEPPAAIVALPSPAAIANRKCYSIGPLEDDAQIAAMRTWLVALGGNPVLRVDERRELERYWVYFPPVQTQEEALQKVERMRSEGIEDVIAVPKGDMANAISLGVFSQRISLERRLQELKKLGYEPSIMPRYRTEEASWFDVSFEEGERLSQSELSARFPDTELSDASCASPEIAGGGAGS